ncbi:DJ-1/PfpI family protein [Oceanimonas sp. NS1]|nr:DJ-1/PfpI family protein [Oceanimonas sp. NS1]
MNTNKTLAILCFDGMTMMDAIGPHEVLANCPGIEVIFVSKSAEVLNDHQTLRFLPVKSLTEVTRADYLLIPGAPDMGHVLEDVDILSWVKAIDAGSDYTLSVCSGSCCWPRLACWRMFGLAVTGLTLTSWRSWGLDRCANAFSMKVNTSPLPGCRPVSIWRCIW